MAALLKKQWIVSTFKKAGVSLKESLVERKKSLSLGISRYLFASHEVNMLYLT